MDLKKRILRLGNEDTTVVVWTGPSCDNCCEIYWKQSEIKLDWISIDMNELQKDVTSKVPVSKKYDESDDFRNNELQTMQNVSENSMKTIDIVDSETLEDKKSFLNALSSDAHLGVRRYL